jgi:hypothetical protein
MAVQVALRRTLSRLVRELFLELLTQSIAWRGLALAP